MPISHPHFCLVCSRLLPPFESRSGGKFVCFFVFRFAALIPLRGLFLLLARHSLQAASALASCVGSAFRLIGFCRRSNRWWGKGRRDWRLFNKGK